MNNIKVQRIVKNQNTLKVTNEFYNYPNLFEVNNYLEAAGIILAIRKGINLNSLQRPLKKIQEYSYPINNVE